MAKHLSLTERAIIERGLALGESFAEMSSKLGRSATTIAREVKRHRVYTERFLNKNNDCTRFHGCLRNNLCNTAFWQPCYQRCKLCTEKDCREICPQYESKACPLLEKPPYVCNNCKKQKGCKRNHAYYAAHRADTICRKNRSESRKGIRTPPERLVEIGNLISPLIRKGQSINHILATHKPEIGLSEKTLYNYIDANAFKVKNIDLPKKVAYRPRQKDKPVLTKVEYKCRRGRTIEDFNAYLKLHPDTKVVEMDTVKGAHGSKKTLLTMVFREDEFLLAFLMPDGTQESVIAVFDSLTSTLGLDLFRKLFPVILTDNGVEFKDPNSLEVSKNNCPRTKIFYCDPQASWQKPHIENCHLLLRRILPKGLLFTPLTKNDVTLMLCHINSFSRERLGNQTPFQRFSGKEKEKLLELLDLAPVLPDEVIMKPSLLHLTRK